jgi:hypothetical protein
MSGMKNIISPQRHKGHKEKEVPKVLKVPKVKLSSNFSSLITLAHFSSLQTFVCFVPLW